MSYYNYENYYKTAIFCIEYKTTEKMIAVVVILSAYNGERTIARQLDSILSQIGVAVTCYIRDDGSNDKTLDIVHSYQKKNANIIVQEGENIGWEKSFMEALRNAPQADFYAFSDQDDLWMKDKLYAGIKELEKYPNDRPLFYHCNKISVDENLNPYMHQVRRTPKPLNHQNAMIQEYAQGCSIIMNNKAKDLVLAYIPKKKIAHDFWCGLLCYLFGEIIYDNNKHFYHISYGSNASGEGHMLKSWSGRLKRFIFENEIYYSPYQDLIDGFSDKLSEEDKKFCEKVINYKSNFRDKLYLFFSPKFLRDSIIGTLSLKLAILFNKL
jgi:rhamnosyltransferase